MRSGRPALLERMELRATLRGLKDGRLLGDYPDPDPSIVRQMKEIDPALEAHFNRISRKWTVWRRCESGMQILFNIQNSKQHYMDLDSRVLLYLRRMDSRTRGMAGIEETIQETIKENRSRRKSENAEMMDLHIQSARVVAKDADRICGATNVPKEDVRVKEPEPEPDGDEEYW